ncbi:uncharacterized protein Triagg1_10740 [Trichoderma aggressivum f. europaeum]|uniref:DUF4238 domain-containing protein n=1 Tax=Trichoderma aggressivum f. europaeum TaxID=173218 RepID=A0AAE1I5H2_9HYPO|nr:hypothetical protein Triagg1_10740 [Trichoderma aggressivum f. europaeum]
MEAHKPEYQHFIPQFLLRNFSHKYVPPDRSKAGRPEKRDSKKKKMYPGDQAVNSLCLSDDEFCLDECSVRRICGLENMYVNPTKPSQDHGHLEKKFAVFENKASCIYRKIMKAHKDGKPAILLKRTEKDVLRKFVYLLTYRGEQFYRKYNVDGIEDYDDGDKELLQHYMAKHGFTKPIDVWLQSLEAIMDLDIDTEGCWKQHISKSIYFPIADQFIDHICDMYMAICTPVNPDEEFVLTDNCYNVCEGRTVAYFDASTGKHVSMGPRFHNFAPISPRLMIVLRSAHLPEPLEDADPAIKQWRQFQRRLYIDSIFGSGIESILEDLPVQKALNNYMEIVDGRLAPRPGWNRRLGINDSFCFTIFKVPTRHVRTINGLLIDHAYHGSRIIFNRKDIFLDLMEWYLTEPCEVGKNLTGDNALKQLQYIEGLSNFMSRQGREISPKMAFWPSEDRDLTQLQLKNIAGARFLEGVRLKEGSIGFGFDAIYEKLGGTVAALEEDMAMTRTMLQIWTRCVDLDWGCPGYESIRRTKLAFLLDGYQRQPCCRFWMFLKWMRLAQQWGLESIQVMATFFEQACRGPEDMLAYAHPVIQQHELNMAMYKSFNESMARIRGTGCDLESMGLFSLFGDESWRIPTPFSRLNQPCEIKGDKDGPDVNKTVRRSSLDSTKKRKASTQPPRQNQRFKHDEMKEKVGVSNASHSWLFATENRRVPTGPVEQTKPCDDDEPKDVSDDVKNADTAHPSLFHNESWKPPIDPKEEANEQLELTTTTILLTCTAYAIVAALAVSLLATCSYLLAHLSHSAVWLLDSLPWLWDTLSPAFYTLGRFLLVTCSHLLAAFVHFLVWMLNDLAELLDTLSAGLYDLGRILFCLGLALVYSCLVVLKAKGII